MLELGEARGCCAIAKHDVAAVKLSRTAAAARVIVHTGCCHAPSPSVTSSERHHPQSLTYLALLFMAHPGPNPQLKSDVVRRAPLDSGLIRRQNALGAASGLGGGSSSSAAEQQTSEQYLTQLNEEWHKRVDHDVRALAVGMGALVQTALVSLFDGFWCDQSGSVVGEVRWLMQILVAVWMEYSLRCQTPRGRKRIG